jgi:hypothetical protein
LVCCGDLPLLVERHTQHLSATPNILFSIHPTIVCAIMPHSYQPSPLLLPPLSSKTTQRRDPYPYLLCQIVTLLDQHCATVLKATHTHTHTHTNTHKHTQTHTHKHTHTNTHTNTHTRTHINRQPDPCTDRPKPIHTPL